LAAARKFAFDTVFAPDGNVVRTVNNRSHFSVDEVEVETAAAFERGKFEAGTSAEAHAARAAEALAQQAAAINARLNEERAAMRAEAAALALAIARQVAGAALKAYGDERIVAAVEEAMELLRAGPRLLIRVPTDSYNTLRARLETAAQQNAYEGALVVREDAGLAAGDVTIDWAEGAIALDAEALYARIEEIIGRALESARATEESQA